MRQLHVSMQIPGLAVVLFAIRALMTLSLVDGLAMAPEVVLTISNIFQLALIISMTKVALFNRPPSKSTFSIKSLMFAGILVGNCLLNVAKVFKMI